MKVFLSWSGESSRRAAAILHEWLPSVLQNISAYMSAENIEKGERWSIDIASQLQETNYGIVCVTPANIEAPWIMFESGALSKSIQNSKVSPIIFGLNPSDLAKSPLLQFQMTQFVKEDIRRLVSSINASSPENERVSIDIANRAFARAWNELDASISEIDFSQQNNNLNKSGDRKTITAESSLESAIEEILTNSRSLLKTLNSSEEFISLSAAKQLFHKMKNNLSIERDHPAWRDIADNLARLELLSDVLEDTVAKGSSVDTTTPQELREFHRSIRLAVNFVLSKIYGASDFHDISRLALRSAISAKRNRNGDE